MVIPSGVPGRDPPRGGGEDAGLGRASASNGSYRSQRWVDELASASNNPHEPGSKSLQALVTSTINNEDRRPVRSSHLWFASLRYCWRFGFAAVCRTKTEEERECLCGDEGAHDLSTRDDRKETNNSLLANDGDRDHLHCQGPARYSAI
ncbi:unnamed protein product [Ectocarpus sp. 8 AP-2014]